MNIRIYPSKPHGSMEAMASKSDVHRALICAAFSDRETIIHSNSISRDMEATASCLRAAGAAICYDPGEGLFIVSPGRIRGEGPGDSVPADCRESGSTLRFLIPVFAAAGISTRFTGEGRLPERPLKPILFELSAHGISVKGEKLPISIKGSMTPGSFSLPGDISSQFVSGLLLAFPLMEGDSRLSLTTGLESQAYVDMTMDTMKRFGIRISRSERDGKLSFSYKKNEGHPGYVSPFHYEADGDWSNAAFFLAADMLLGGGQIKVNGLREDSVQGDRAIADILKELSHGKGCVLDASSVPDLVPICAVAMALTPGKHRIVNAGRLRIKESDRLSAISEGLQRMGADITELPEGLIIEGKAGELPGGTEVSSFNDHRIAMALSIGALFCRKPVEITGAEAVEKSYPGFFDDLRRLGVRLERTGGTGCHL